MTSSTRVVSEARLLERGRRCRRSRRARSRGSTSPRAKGTRPGLVVDRDQPARRGSLPRPHHRLRQQPVLDRVDALAQGLDGVAGERRRRARSRSPRPYRRPRPRSEQSLPHPRRPPRARPRAGARPGTRGAAPGWTFTTRPGKRSRKDGRSRCMYPAQTTSSAPLLLEPVAIAASRASRSGYSSSGKTAAGRRRPRPARAPARRARSTRRRRRGAPRRAAPGGSSPLR